MKRIFGIAVVAALMFSITGCMKTDEKSVVEQAEQLMREDNDEKAINKLKVLLEKEPQNIDAWNLIAESLIKQEKYDEANEWLQSYLAMVDENLNSDTFEMAKAVDAIGDFGRDMRRNGETPGEWYEAIKPEPVSTESIYYNYSVGEIISVDVPENMTVLYTLLDGSNPRSEGIVYKEGISIDEAGTYKLQFVTRNKYNEYSSVQSVYIDVFDEGGSSYDDSDTITSSIDLDLPEVDIEPGEYTSRIDVSVTNYDLNNENLELVYTVDGSDPRLYGDSTRYYYESIPLVVGSYHLAIAAYDYETDETSEVAYYDYRISQPGMLSLGLFDLPARLVENCRQIFDDAGLYSDIYVEVVNYNSIDELDFNNLPDILITNSKYTSALADTGFVADVSTLFDIDTYNLIGDIIKTGEYEDKYYMMPLTVRPEYMLFGDYYEDEPITYDVLSGESDWYMTYFAMAANDPELFLGFYYSVGGEVLDIESGNITMDKEKLVEALNLMNTFISDNMSNNKMRADELQSQLEEYDVELFAFGDDFDFISSYYYSVAGVLPMPNDYESKLYNVTTGMYFSNLSIMEDASRVDQFKKVYEYLAIDNVYEIISLAENISSIPANIDVANQVSAFGYLPGEDMIQAVERGISVPRTMKLDDFYDSVLQEPLNGFANGDSVETTAENIMNNLGN